MNAKQLAETVRAINHKHKTAQWDDLSGLMTIVRDSNLTEPQMRTLARSLHWEGFVSIEDLWCVFPVGPDELNRWVEDGTRTFKCAECASDIRIKFKTMDDVMSFEVGSMTCCRCHRHAVLRNEAREDEARKALLVKELKAISYDDYLKSDHWQEVRRQALDTDVYACRICSSTESLNVHHRTYERRGQELPEDVITLCRSCHQIFHENGKLAKVGG